MSSGGASLGTSSGGAVVSAVVSPSDGAVSLESSEGEEASSFVEVELWEGAVVAVELTAPVYAV